MPTGYNIYAYGDLVAARPHRKCYRQALQQAINRDTVVLDIGAGTGIFALLACQ